MAVYETMSLYVFMIRPNCFNLSAYKLLRSRLRPRFRSLAVDVSSGVESAKGIKDAGLIHQFVAAVRAGDVLLARSPNALLSAT